MREAEEKINEPAQKTEGASELKQPANRRTPVSADSPFTRGITLRSLRVATEIEAISRALEETGWNRKRAAELLAISYRGLLHKIRKHNITPPRAGAGFIGSDSWGSKG